MNTRISAMAVGAALVLGFGAGTALAGTAAKLSDGMNTYVVRYSDLDLNKIDGAAALYGRLRHAADKVCESLQSRDLTLNAQYQACVNRAVSSAVSSVGAAMLSQYHESRVKGDKKVAMQLANAI